MATRFSEVDRTMHDFFLSGYDVINMFKLHVKTPKQMGITVVGIHNIRSNKIDTYFENSNVIKKSNYLIKLTEKWNSKRSINTEASIIGLIPGLTLSADVIMECNKRSKILKLTSEYHNEYVALNLDTKFKGSKPIINASAVAAYNGLTGGVKVEYSTSKKALNLSKFIMSYMIKNAVFTANVTNMELISGSMFTTYVDRINLGLKCCWSIKHHTGSAVVGSQYQVNKALKLRAKFNNKGQLYIGSSIKINKSAKLTLVNLIECFRFNSSPILIGIGVEFNL
ncbi:voltage-dependent anion-selective channel-like [Melanaphis sacchari]|uniref:voltage-dependent anion-selective channel-like n=1 Tax=Melanaphis sacchari TaxID=742174 RepID=UPI000DC13013|nr:voltage-dependent anion-selective channel-like [Melanaphis sacchari]